MLQNKQDAYTHKHTQTQTYRHTQTQTHKHTQGSNSQTHKVHLSALEVRRKVCCQDGLLKVLDEALVLRGGEGSRNVVAVCVEDHEALVQVVVLHRACAVEL